MTKLVRGLLVILIGTAIWLMPIPAGLKPAAWQLFAIFVATIAAFILQPLPIGAIAFISVTFTTLIGVLKPAEALSGFSNGTIWLIVSAFLFAKGFIKTGLGKRIAYVLIRFMGDSTLKLGYTLALSDLIIAPATPSNTARAGGIIFPIVKSLASAFDSEPGPSSRRVGSYLVQTAYQNNTITSAMFMTAMAGNPLIALLAQQTLNIQISWGLWALAAIVPGLLSLLIIPYFLYKVYPPEVTRTPEAKLLAITELKKMGVMSREEKIVAAVFVGSLILWSTATITKLDATVVAMLAVSIMLLTSVLTWKDVLEEQGAWDTLIWMGVLIGLADFLLKLGFIPWFAQSIGNMMIGIPWLYALMILLVVYMCSLWICQPGCPYYRHVRCVCFSCSFRRCTCLSCRFGVCIHVKSLYVPYSLCGGTSTHPFWIWLCRPRDLVEAWLLRIRDQYFNLGWNRFTLVESPRTLVSTWKRRKNNEYHHEIR